MSDTCSGDLALHAQGHQVVATDSAKQAHYLPAITGVQTWFGIARGLRRRRAHRPLDAESLR